MKNLHVRWAVESDSQRIKFASSADLQGKALRGGLFARAASAGHGEIDLITTTDISEKWHLILPSET